MLYQSSGLETGQAARHQHYHLLGSGMTLWVAWQASTIIGVIAGTTIPNSWSLSFAIPLTFYCCGRPQHSAAG